MGLDKLLHHRFLSTNSYEIVHSLPESKRLELATADTVLALVAAVCQLNSCVCAQLTTIQIHLHHKATQTDPAPLFSHRFIALPLTLSQLIKEHRPRQVLDSYLRTRPRPPTLPQTQPWNVQTLPPTTTHSMFANYRVLESIKGSSHVTVGVYVDGKQITTEHGATVYEAEELVCILVFQNIMLLVVEF
jgi:hypothetical protein